MHGYHCDRRVFIRQKEYFSTWYDCKDIDLKGFGDNRFMPKPYSLDDYADDLILYVKDNCKSLPIIVAHSFGARVVVKALDKGLKISKLVLTGSAGLMPRFNFKRFAKKVVFKTFKGVMTDKTKQRFYSPDYLKCDPVMRQSFKLVVNEDLKPLYKKVDVDTLLVFGKLDKETPLYMAKKQRKFIKNSKLIVLKDTGHFCFIDRADVFNQIVFAFLMGKAQKNSKI